MSGFVPWLGKIFGGGKALEQGLETVDKATTGVIAGMDALFYTDEEKAHDSVKVTQMRMDMVKSLQDSFAPRSVTRRVLAIIIVGSTFLHFNIAIVLGLLANLWPKMITIGDKATNAWDGALTYTMSIIAQEIKIALIVVFFYFGYYGVKQIIQKRNGG